MFNLRYWGALAAAKHGARHIRADGSITFTTGIASARPQTGRSLMSSVCGAVEALLVGRVGRRKMSPPTCS